MEKEVLPLTIAGLTFSRDKNLEKYFWDAECFHVAHYWKPLYLTPPFIPKNSVQYTTKLLTRNQESSPCQFDRTHVSALLRFCTKALPFLFCKLAHLKLGFSSAFRNFNVEALCSCLISSAYEESPVGYSFNCSRSFLFMC